MTTSRTAFRAFRPAFALTPLTLLSAATLGAQSGKPVTDEAVVQATAKAIQAKVLSIDTHVDISPTNFAESGPNYATKLPRTQVDLVKMEEGGLAGAFLVVYVGQAPTLDAASFAKANAQAIEKFEAIHRLTEKIAPTRAEIAYTAADARRIHATGKRVIFIGVENAFPIGSDIANVKKFYDLGGRYMSLAHNGHSQLSDSNTGERDGVAAQRPLAVGPAGHRRDEPCGHHGRCVAPVEGVDDADGGAEQGADHGVTLGRARDLQPQPQHG